MSEGLRVYKITVTQDCVRVWCSAINPRERVREREPESRPHFSEKFHIYHHGNIDGAQSFATDKGYIPDLIADQIFEKGDPDVQDYATKERAEDR